MTRLLAGLFVVLTIACTADPTGAENPPTGATPVPTEGASRAVDDTTTLLVYIRKNRMRGYDIERGTDVELREVAGPDVTLSPDGAQIALVTDLKPGTDPEGFAEPYITVTDVVGEGQEIVMGPGRSPRWSPDGRQLAATTDDGVAIYDVASGEATSVLAGDGWTVLGWSDTMVAAVGPDGTVLVGADGERIDIDTPPAKLWGVSPTDDTLVDVGPAQPTLLSATDDAQSVPIQIEGGMGDGAWSPNGSTIAVVQVGEGQSRALLIDSGTGEVRTVEEGNGAQGNVVWSQDSQTFAFVRVDPENKLKLQAVVCQASGACRPGFSWAQGVMLLGFSSQT